MAYQQIAGAALMGLGTGAQLFGQRRAARNYGRALDAEYARQKEFNEESFGNLREGIGIAGPEGYRTRLAARSDGLRSAFARNDATARRDRGDAISSGGSSAIQRERTTETARKSGHRGSNRDAKVRLIADRGVFADQQSDMIDAEILNAILRGKMTRSAALLQGDLAAAAQSGGLAKTLGDLGVQAGQMLLTSGGGGGAGGGGSLASLLSAAGGS